ncbi:hypothetical protein [Erythrobacter mangrovi]|uniref:Uncharacterized protein n=1 Tax=Erythrobacter mangrovi TaxID=2739433 RepID=A0A7D3Y051_9SPHN|nr:hypothetical protein [Erythrobacter mangrovi]QKG71552.1 hypothetical protein HQR01_09360 [Erythrobacter mangrovi]
MRVPFLLCIAAMTIAADTPEDIRAGGQAEHAMMLLGLPDASTTDCHDRISKARQGEAKPELDRQPASADQPYLIAAVDQRVNGCSVMVMHHDKTDFRSLPLPSEGPLRLEPAN